MTFLVDFNWLDVSQKIMARYYTLHTLISILVGLG